MPDNKILVVDDDEGFVRIVKIRLESKNYKVACAYSGEEALRYVSRDKPNLIILDVIMRPMDGKEVYKRLRANPETREIPVMFMSGKLESIDDLADLDIEPENFLSKPYDPADLFARVEANLARRRSEIGEGMLFGEGPGKSHKEIFLAKILVSKGLVTQQKVDEFFANRKKLSGSTIKDIVEYGICDERSILTALSEAFYAPYIELKDTPIAPEAIEKIPPKYAWYYNIMPIRIEEGHLVCAISDPLSISKVTDDIKVYLNLRLKFVLTKEEEIAEAIKKFYGVGAETVEQILSDETVGEPEVPVAIAESDEDIAKLAGDASVIRLVNQILVEAREKKATDIHIEPYRGRLKLRYRIDGILTDVKLPPEIMRFLPAIISRIKIMSGLDIVERRLPQDGKSNVKIKDEMYDLRVSTLPSVYGESIVIRVLPTKMLFSLERLGFSESDRKIFEELIRKPHGVIFVTGPTGSGKTTTLYTALTKIKAEHPGAKVITIEDPIEYELEGITQIQVNPEIDLTFARGLRSMLRHDPDLMMVGEVRDFETAEIAIRMALTGHLLFSTLHTNDAASGITRLIDIGVEAYLVASSVEAFIAQRLVRVICDKCKEELPVMDGKLKIKRAYHGKGCEACGFSGYRGRSAIFEILIVDDDIKKLIMQKAPANEIKSKAIANGMKTLWDDGKDKIEKGITTLEEILHVTQSEE